LVGTKKSLIFRTSEKKIQFGRNTPNVNKVMVLTSKSKIH